MIFSLGNIRRRYFALNVLSNIALTFNIGNFANGINYIKTNLRVYLPRKYTHYLKAILFFIEIIAKTRISPENSIVEKYSNNLTFFHQKYKDVLWLM